MTYNIQIARKSVRTDGVLIEVTVSDKHGKFEKTRRVNPAFKIQHDALKVLSGLNRRMEYLQEEREQAEAKQRKSESEESEFRI